jgi:hypothetical protein
VIVLFAMTWLSPTFPVCSFDLPAPGRKSARFRAAGIVQGNAPKTSKNFP